MRFVGFIWRVKLELEWIQASRKRAAAPPGRSIIEPSERQVELMTNVDGFVAARAGGSVARLCRGVGESVNGGRLGLTS
jgi:hypothetical protein